MAAKCVVFLTHAGQDNTALSNDFMQILSPPRTRHLQCACQKTLCALQSVCRTRMPVRDMKKSHGTHNKLCFASLA